MNDTANLVTILTGVCTVAVVLGGVAGAFAVMRSQIAAMNLKITALDNDCVKREVFSLHIRNIEDKFGTMLGILEEIQRRLPH